MIYMVLHVCISIAMFAYFVARCFSETAKYAFSKEKLVVF